MREREREKKREKRERDHIWWERTAWVWPTSPMVADDVTEIESGKGKHEMEEDLIGCALKEDFIQSDDVFVFGLTKNAIQMNKENISIKKASNWGKRGPDLAVCGARDAFLWVVDFELLDRHHLLSKRGGEKRRSVWKMFSCCVHTWVGRWTHRYTHPKVPSPIWSRISYSSIT